MEKMKITEKLRKFVKKLRWQGFISGQIIDSCFSNKLEFRPGCYADGYPSVIWTPKGYVLQDEEDELEAWVASYEK